MFMHFPHAQYISNIGCILFGLYCFIIYVLTHLIIATINCAPINQLGEHVSPYLLEYTTYNFILVFTINFQIEYS